MTGLRIAALALLLLFGAAWMVEPGFYRAVQLFAGAVLLLEAVQFGLGLRRTASRE